MVDGDLALYIDRKIHIGILSHLHPLFPIIPTKATKDTFVALPPCPLRLLPPFGSFECQTTSATESLSTLGALKLRPTTPTKTWVASFGEEHPVTVVTREIKDPVIWVKREPLDVYRRYIYIYMIFTDILHIISMYPLSLGTDSPKVMFRNEVVAGQTSGGSKTIKRKSRIGMFCHKQYSQGNFSYLLDQYHDQQGLHTLCHRSQIFLDPDWINSAQTQSGFDLGCPFWRIGLAGIGLYIYGEILGKWQTKSNWIVYFLKFGWFFHDKMVAPYHHRRMIYSSAYSHGSVKTLTFARKGNIIVLVWDLLFMILGGRAS